MAPSVLPIIPTKKTKLGKPCKKAHFKLGENQLKFLKSPYILDLPETIMIIIV